MESRSYKLAKIGTLGEARGLRGEVWLRIQSRDPLFLKRLSESKIILRHEDQMQELQPKTIRILFNKVSCLFEGLENRNLVEPLKGKEIYVDASLLESEPGEEIFLSEVLGFTVFNGTQKLGVVEGFETNGPQDLLKVNTSQGAALIPFIKAFLKSIDFKERQILMELPEGLVDVNASHAL